MPYSEQEIGNSLFKGIEQIRAHPDFGEEWVLAHLGPLLENYRYLEALYAPGEALASRIDDYMAWCENDSVEDPGQLMEEIALLAFRCLKDAGGIRSYQSYAPQYDLVVSGSPEDDLGWRLLMGYLRLKEWDTIVVEAKNTDSKVDVEQFARLCWILDHVFTDLAGLGIFISRTGATGFPTSARRQRSLQAARAAQIIFHARTGKYVIVIDHDDIPKLTEPGTLPRLIRAKMRDVEEATGLPVEFNIDDWRQVDLPPHLSQHMSDSSKDVEE